MSLGAALRLGLRVLQEQGVEYALIGGIARNQWANPREDQVLVRVVSIERRTSTTYLKRR